jgi:hypothetical protein
MKHLKIGFDYLDYNVQMSLCFILHFLCHLSMFLFQLYVNPMVPKKTMYMMHYSHIIYFL